MRKVNGIIIFDTEKEAREYFIERYLPDFFKTRLGEPFTEKENG